MNTKIPNTNYINQPDCHQLSHICGNYGLIPYVGNTLELIRDLYAFVDKNYKTFGHVSRIKVFGQPALLVVGAENLKRIILDKEKNFSTKMGYKNTLGHFYENGLLLTDFDTHRVQRRMFQTAFKTDQMRSYVSVINRVFKDSISSWKNQNNFLFLPAIKKSLLEIGATVFIGVDKSRSKMDQINRAFLDISEKGLMSLFKWDIPGFNFHKGKKGARFLEDYFKQIIPARRQGTGLDMLTFMTKETMENGQHFPDNDIIKQISFLLSAAHDTTTSVLNLIVLYLAKHTDWQDKLRKEARQVNQEQLEYAGLDQVPLMDLVFKETLRMHPSVSLMQRRTIRKTTIDGHQVPANTIITMPPVYNHYMDEFWTNPHTFDPMRFSTGREEHKKHSFCYMPFGGGAHKCIGMHFANMVVKCFMQQFLLRYQWSLPEGYRPKLDSLPLPKTADGLPILMEPVGPV